MKTNSKPIKVRARIKRESSFTATEMFTVTEMFTTTEMFGG